MNMITMETNVLCRHTTHIHALNFAYEIFLFVQSIADQFVLQAPLIALTAPVAPSAPTRHLPPPVRALDLLHWSVKSTAVDQTHSKSIFPNLSWKTRQT